MSRTIDRSCAGLAACGIAFSVFSLLSAPAGAQTASTAEAPGGLQEVVVTATRHEESASRVPISITALTQENLDERGIRDIRDIARFTPGVNVDNSGTGNISIRGIASSGGAGTTGIYIDDTPIQIRTLAFNPDDALPKSFDIDRVEVLRGPQGTLFGAGSEGGTVRYITTQPSLTKRSVYGRSELAFTQGGSPSYEAGVAAGGPLVDGTLGARLSVWYRRDGGWIDRVDPSAPHAVQERNANYGETSLLRLAAIWAVADRWTVAPSVYYQRRMAHQDSIFWPVLSDAGSDRYQAGTPSAQPGSDRFWLPSLRIEGDLGRVRLISNTSYFDRTEKAAASYDGTLYNLGFYQDLFIFNPAYPAPNFPLYLDGNGTHLPAGASGYRSPSTITNRQQNFTEEVRLQSADAGGPLVWTLGAFYGSNRQSYAEDLMDPQLNTLLQASYPVAGVPTPAGCTPVATPDCYVTDFFGVGFDPAHPNESYFSISRSRDEQIALFGEATWAVIDRLRLTAGARVSHVRYTVENVTGGPQVFGPNATVNAAHSETAFTPRLSVAWQQDPDDMYYATYAKGFRPGGANTPVPQAACAQDFANFGITASPATFNADTVQSYEIGAKNAIARRLRIASSIYYISWNNIQQTVLPPICQIPWIQNLGTATAKGADIQAEFALTDAFTLELAAGYTDARYTKGSFVGTSSSVPPVAAKGDAITGQGGQPGAPVTATVGAEYRFGLFGRNLFVRLDDQYQARPRWASPGQDPGTLQYDPANFMLGSMNFVNLRAGVELSEWQLSAFVDNLADAHPITNYSFSINPGTGASRLERAWGVRPRTFGLTLTLRR